jgi:hypothetical protein
VATRAAKASDILQKAEARRYDSYIPTSQERVTDARFDSRRERIQNVDAWYAGDYATAFPGEVPNRISPFVKNLVNSGTNDMVRLIVAAKPSIICPVLADTEKAEKQSVKTAQAMRTWWTANRGDRMVVYLAFDLILTGAAYVECWPELDKLGNPISPYPKFSRIDPRYAFPNFTADKMHDLYVISDMKLREAVRMYPSLGLDPDADRETDDVRVVDVYEPDYTCKVLYFVQGGGPAGNSGYLIEESENPTERLPVAWAKTPTGDGHFRGLMDQVGEPLQLQNQMVYFIKENMERMAFAGTKGKGALNSEEYGPKRHIELDPDVEGADFQEIEPARIAPEYFGVIQMLKDDTHGQVGIAPARAGDVRQSIASAAFVASVQGQQSTTVEDYEQQIAYLREDLNEIAFHQDKAALNFDKPMLVRGPLRTYTPSVDLGEYPSNSVVYGYASGLDKLNRNVLLEAAARSRLLSRREAIVQGELSEDPDATMAAIEKEGVRDTLLAALQQLLISDPTQAPIVGAAFNKGQDIFEVMEQLQAAQAQAAPPAQPELGAGGPPGAGPPGGAQAAQLALLKGGQEGSSPTLGEVPNQTQVSLPPLNQMVQSNVGPGLPA